MTVVAFNDIAALGEYIAEDYGDWGEACELTQRMIDDFAELTSDTQWIHVDEARAKDGPFGGTVAHGFLVLSLMPAVRPPTCYRLAGYSAVANYGIRELRFLQPVPSGARIHSHGRLLQVEEHRRGTLLTQEVAIQQVDADKPSVVLQLQLLYM